MREPQCFEEMIEEIFAACQFIVTESESAEFQAENKAISILSRKIASGFYFCKARNLKSLKNTIEKTVMRNKKLAVIDLNNEFMLYHEETCREIEEKKKMCDSPIAIKNKRVETPEGLPASLYKDQLTSKIIDLEKIIIQRKEQGLDVSDVEKEIEQLKGQVQLLELQEQIDFDMLAWELSGSKQKEVVEVKEEEVVEEIEEKQEEVEEKKEDEKKEEIRTLTMIINK
jgi:hypothetical protein